MSKQKTNEGGLWKNNNRTKDTHAQANGSAFIDCPHCHKTGAFFVDAWTNEKDGTKWQKLKFKARDKQPDSEPAPDMTSPGDDGEIPF